MKLVILDRDGVIDRESAAYIKTPDEWHPIPGSIEAIAALNQRGFTVAVATNQSGVARGYYDEAILQRIHEKMHHYCERGGAHIDFIAYCPHHPDASCLCRKPAPGMLHRIAAHYNTSLQGVPFVGDRLTDIDTAIAAGATPYFLDRHLISEQTLSPLLPSKFSAVPCFSDLHAFTEHMVFQSE